MAVDSEALKQGDLLGAVGVGAGGLGAIGTILLWIAISVVIIAIFLGIIWWYYSRRLFNQDVRVYGRVGGKPTLKFVDKGRYLGVGMAGDKLFVLRKTKKHLPPPNIQAGRNEWWYWIREDGEYINIGPEDVDEIQKKMRVKFVDTDVRMARLGIEKNLRDRLQKQTFWSKYGNTIMMVLFVVIVMVALIVLFNKITEVATALESSAGAVNNMANALADFYANRSSLAPTSQGGGLIPVS